MRRQILSICTGTAAGAAICLNCAGIPDLIADAAAKAALLILPVFMISAYVTVKIKAVRTDDHVHDISEILPAILFAAAFSISFLLSSLCDINIIEENRHLIKKNGIYLTGTVVSAEERRYPEAVIDTGHEKILVYLHGDTKNISGYGNAEDISCIAGKKIRISCSDEPEMPEGRRNPGCFDYALYLRSIGITGTVTADTHNVDLYGGSENLFYRICGLASRMRYHFYEELSHECGRERAGIIQAMLFGEKDHIEKNIYEGFQKGGTAHVLAVSGLHVASVYALVIFATMKRKTLPVRMISALMLISYMILSSFSPSVVRAVSMILIRITADVLKRRYDMTCAAALCMTAAIFKNPYIIFNAGFRLSYTAVFLISYAGKALAPYTGKDIAVYIAVQAGMMPLLIYTFNSFSLSSFIANIPVVFLAGIIVPFGIMAFTADISGAGGHIFMLLADMTGSLCDIMVKINESIYSDGKYTFDAVSPGMYILILFYGSLLLVCSECFYVCIRRKKYKKIIFLAALIGIMACISLPLSQGSFHDAFFVFVDVGEGDCMHLKTETGKNFLFDGGGKKDIDVGMTVLKPYLLKNGVRYIDMAFVSHMHRDHFQGIASLCRDGMVKKLCVYDANTEREGFILSETGMKKEDIIYVKRGDEVPLDGNGYIRVISPMEKEKEGIHELSDDNENEISLIIKAVYKNASVLMTGDINSETENRLVDDYGGELRSAVLKAAHHGSRFSSSEKFIRAVGPSAFVIQTGKNRYGHPSESVIEKCERNGIIVYRNDRDGAVGICRRDGRNIIVTMRKEKQGV